MPFLYQGLKQYRDTINLWERLSDADDPSAEGMSLALNLTPLQALPLVGTALYEIGVKLQNETNLLFSGQLSDTDVMTLPTQAIPGGPLLTALQRIQANHNRLVRDPP